MKNKIKKQKMTHKHKVRLARKMRTKFDIKLRIPIFLTSNWMKRKIQIEKRVKSKLLSTKKQKENAK